MYLNLSKQNLSDKQAPRFTRTGFNPTGLSPASRGRLLTEAYEAQLEGLFHCRKTAQQWLANRLSANEGTAPPNHDFESASARITWPLIY